MHSTSDMNVSGEMSHEVYSKDEAMQIKMSDQLFSKRRVVVEQGRGDNRRGASRARRLN